MTRKIEDYPINKILAEIGANNFSYFSKFILSEKTLKSIAETARSQNILEKVVKIVIFGLTQNPTRSYDWNCGSLIQHANPEIVINFIKEESSNREKFYDSIGLAWCLGEFGMRDQFIIDFLEDTIEYANNSESWWRAANSLQKLCKIDAIRILKSSLKARNVPKLEVCLNDIGNKFNVIGILMHSKLNNLHRLILPKIKRKLISKSPSSSVINSAIWLIGRFKFQDQEIEQKLRELLNSNNYEIKFYVLQTIRDIGSIHFLDDLGNFLEDDDPLLRKMAAQGLGNVDDPKSLELLYKRLMNEENTKVVSDITRSIYDLTHYEHKHLKSILHSFGANENGMISDEADKWYTNPDIYHIFAISQDPKNLCMKLLFERLHKLGITTPCDPIDLGSGTGRLAWYILNNIRFQGKIHCIDYSKQMKVYLSKRLKRECISAKRVSIHCDSIVNLPNIKGIGKNSSQLITANFAFPSKMSNKQNNLKELKAVYECLRPDGYLVTIGWDETFNDELSEMWYRYIPDNIEARTFEEWREKKVDGIKSPRNCYLNWYKRGLMVPLEFQSVDISAKVMGYLFGRDAVNEILKNKRTRWSISIGITIDKKEQIEKVLRKNSLLHK